MTKDEALRLALEALTDALNKPMWNRVQMEAAITAIKAALEAKDEPVAFKIYKPTPPRGAIPNVRDAELPWVYDQDPSSGNVASMWVTPVKYTMQPQQAEKQEPLRLWLWKNFVDGKPEYWAFNNPFPCISVEGDPLTLGEPCGWAFLKPSVNGRPHRSEQEVINTVTRLATTPPQRTWVGLTNQELADCWDTIPERAMRRVEAKLKEKNT